MDSACDERVVWESHDARPDAAPPGPAVQASRAMEAMLAAALLPAPQRSGLLKRPRSRSQEAPQRSQSTGGSTHGKRTRALSPGGGMAPASAAGAAATAPQLEALDDSELRRALELIEQLKGAFSLKQAASPSPLGQPAPLCSASLSSAFSTLPWLALGARSGGGAGTQLRVFPEGSPYAGAVGSSAFGGSFGGSGSGSGGGRMPPSLLLGAWSAAPLTLQRCA